MIARRSFRFKLIASYILVVLVPLGFVAFFLDRTFEESALREITSSLTTQARLIERQIAAERLQDNDIRYLETFVRALSPTTKCRITLIAAQGKVLADSERSEEEVLRMENHLTRPEVKAAAAGASGADIHYSPTLKTEMLYVAVPIRDAAGSVAGILRLALPLEGVQKMLASTRRTILLGLLLAAISSAIVGSLVAARTTGPINRMIQISRRFAQGDFSRRIFDKPGDEIGELAETLNIMAQDIENKIKEIAAQNQKLAAAFTNMIEGIIIVDKATHIVSVNPAIERTFGVTQQDVRGRFFLEVIRNDGIAEIIHSVLEEGRPLSREASLVLPVRRTFQVNASPVFAGAVVDGCLVVLHDITEMRRLETMRRDFVANASHELKTPLTSIKGFVETLLEGAVDDAEHNRAFLEIVRDHTERLNGLVNDLLSLSHLESKEITLEREAIDLRREVDEVVTGFSSHVKKRRITVTNDIRTPFPCRGDTAKIKQVFTNLIDNAIKFNKEEGSIRISCETAGRDMVKISVEDSGIGIPEKSIPRIFERFYRVDKARSRELGGTGLGLAIAKHIVELHGGAIGVTSTEGLGSTFWFTLPT